MYFWFRIRWELETFSRNTNVLQRLTVNDKVGLSKLEFCFIQSEVYIFFGNGCLLIKFTLYNFHAHTKYHAKVMFSTFMSFCLKGGREKF